MKINIILPFKRMTGGLRVVYIYANYLVEQGHDVVCYVPMLSYKGKDQSFLYRMKASLGNTIKKDNWFDKKFSLKIIPIISEIFVRDADITIATAWQTAYDVDTFPDSKGKKFYFVQDFEVFNGERKEVEDSYRLPLKKITVTKALREQLQKLTTDDISVVYNGLYDEEYIGIDKPLHEDLVIMMMYHESEHKKSQEGLKVIKKIKEVYPNVKVNIFGRRIPEILPKEYHVLVNPERNLILDMYRESDIYLFTSDIEAWGLPIVEAMANKCAVIGRSRGALSELYNAKNALLIESLDDMYDAFVTLNNDREKLASIQQSGFETVEQLNWKKSCEEFLNIIVK